MACPKRDDVHDVPDRYTSLAKVVAPGRTNGFAFPVDVRPPVAKLPMARPETSYSLILRRVILLNQRAIDEAIADQSVTKTVVTSLHADAVFGGPRQEFFFRSTDLSLD